VNLGDIVVEGDDILGDGVNVAARLEGIAEPGGICVSAAAHEQIEGKVDATFADLGEQSLKNIARPIRAYSVVVQQSATRSVAATTTLPLPDKPSIAVLPFQNMSGDPDQEYFADGMVEEIITALSRIRWLFVIARNSSFTYKGQAIDVKRVGRELGVRYVLEGSVRKTIGRIRVTVQLVEADTGAHLWADRFDRSLEDVFDVQDQVAASVAGIIEPALQSAEARRSVQRPTSDLTAYDLYLRASALLTPSNRQAHEALHLIEQALERDPRYGPALAWGAICCVQLLNDGRSEDTGRDRLRATEYARRALAVADNDPGVMANSALALAYTGEDIDTVMTLVDRALSLNPNFARGWRISGLLRIWAGEPDIAVPRLETYLRLNPLGRVGGLSFDIGMAHFFRHNFDLAVPKLLVAIQEDPSQAGPYRFLAACYAHIGRIDEARAILERLREFSRVIMPTQVPFRRPKDRKLFLSGLRLAMGALETQADEVIERGGATSFDGGSQ
jgi:adenylate cyclase